MNKESLISAADRAIEVLGFIDEYDLDVTFAETADDIVTLVERFGGLPKEVLSFLSGRQTLQNLFTEDIITLAQIETIIGYDRSIVDAFCQVLVRVSEQGFFCNHLEEFLSFAGKYCAYNTKSAFVKATASAVHLCVECDLNFDEQLIKNVIQCRRVLSDIGSEEELHKKLVELKELLSSDWLCDCTVDLGTIGKLTTEDIAWLHHTRGMCSLQVPMDLRERCKDLTAKQCFYLECATFTDTAFNNLDRAEMLDQQTIDTFTFPLLAYATLNCKNKFVSWFKVERKLWSKYMYSSCCLLHPDFYSKCIDLDQLPKDIYYNNWDYFNANRFYTLEEAEVLCTLNDVADQLYNIGFTLQELKEVFPLNPKYNDNILEAIKDPNRMAQYKMFQDQSPENRLAVLQHDYDWNMENIKYASAMVQYGFRGDFAAEVIRVLNNSSAMQFLQEAAHLKVSHILDNRYRLWDLYADGTLDAIAGYTRKYTERYAQILLYLFRQWVLGEANPVYRKADMPSIWREHRKFDFISLKKLFDFLQEKYPVTSKPVPEDLHLNWSSRSSYDVEPLVAFFNEDHLVEFTDNGARILMQVMQPIEGKLTPAIVKTELGDCTGLDDWYKELSISILNGEVTQLQDVFVPDCGIGRQLIPWTQPMMTQAFVQFWN